MGQSLDGWKTDSENLKGSDQSTLRRVKDWGYDGEIFSLRARSVVSKIYFFVFGSDCWLLRASIGKGRVVQFGQRGSRFNATIKKP